MASSTNQHLAVNFPVAPIGEIASTRTYSPLIVEVELPQDNTELMPKTSNTTNLCSTSVNSLKVFTEIYVLPL